MTIKTIAEHKCFDGVQGHYSHDSLEIGLPMRFCVFQPPQARKHKLPMLIYLAGLTCTEETFMIKAGAQRLAAKYGIVLVTCDTSPRGADVAGEGDDWDFGLGAGFYVDATQSPWSNHSRSNRRSTTAGFGPQPYPPESCSRRGFNEHRESAIRENAAEAVCCLWDSSTS